MCTSVFSSNLFTIILLCPCGSFARSFGRRNFTKFWIWI